jgi:hypothetical protein
LENPKCANLSLAALIMAFSLIFSSDILYLINSTIKLK